MGLFSIVNPTGTMQTRFNLTNILEKLRNCIFPSKQANVTAAVQSSPVNESPGIFNMLTPISMKSREAIFPTKNFGNIPKIEKMADSTNFSKESTKIINDMSKRLNFNSEDLKAAIMFESGGNSRKVNRIGAVGLIQMTKETAVYMGTTVEDLKKMTAEQQLVYVEKYLEKAKKIAGIGPDEKIDQATLYALIFCPARAKGNVLYKRGYDSYKFNSRLDLNNDGIITKEEASKQLDQFYTYAVIT